MEENISYLYYETQTPVHDIEKELGINKRKIRNLVDKRYGKFFRRDQMYWNENQNCYMPKELVELQVVARLRNGATTQEIVEDLEIIPHTVGTIAKKYGLNQNEKIDTDAPDRGDALEEAIMKLWHIKCFTTKQIASKFKMEERLVHQILVLNGVRLRGVRLEENIERKIQKFANKIRGPL